MPMITLTAAEIAAAEAAAIAAAEAAAIQAAQVAAAEAAAQAAATAAAEQAAAQAATQAATQATTSGIQTLAQEVAATPPTGIETLNMAQAPVTGPAPTGIETLNMAQPPIQPPITGPVPTAEEQVLQAFQNAQPPIQPPITGPTTVNPPISEAQYQFLHNSTASTDPAATGEIIKNFPPSTSSLPGGAPPTAAQPAAVQPAASTSVNSLPQDRMLNYEMNTQGVKAPLNQTATYNLTGSGAQPTSEPNFLQSTFKEFKDMSLPNKLLTGMMGATGYEMLTRPKPKEEEKYKSTFKPGLYSGYTPVQPTPYQPRYAVGGIADLGGYSDGGRMLKGPGDGMSDDIPATIAGKQPARLANEEFVIPADVVSHLGNGSSEAGAKQLYKMMDRIRKARTGNKKQGKQINPDKYLA